MMAIWWRSKWNIKLSAFSHLSYEDCIFFILDPNNLFPMEEEEKVKMCPFLVVSLEQVWLLRNKRLQGATIPPLHILCQSINNLTGIYKKAVEGRHRLLTPLHKAEEWIPPPIDYIKMNFDASYLDNQATPGILVGNSIRVIIKAPHHPLKQRLKLPTKL